MRRRLRSISTMRRSFSAWEATRAAVRSEMSTASGVMSLRSLRRVLVELVGLDAQDVQHALVDAVLVVR